MTGASGLLVERGGRGVRGPLAGELERLGLVGLDDGVHRQQLGRQRPRRTRVDHDAHAARRRPSSGRDDRIVRHLEREQQHAPGWRLQTVQGSGHDGAIERTVRGRGDRDLVLAGPVDHDQGHGRGHVRADARSDSHRPLRPRTLASASSAMASSPTAPTNRVVAPNRAAAHAWLALLPPPDRVRTPLTTVSPGRGSVATRTVRSTLIDPTTTTQPPIVAPCFVPATGSGTSPGHRAP